MMQSKRENDRYSESNNRRDQNDNDDDDDNSIQSSELSSTDPENETSRIAVPWMTNTTPGHLSSSMPHVGLNNGNPHHQSKQRLQQQQQLLNSTSSSSVPRSSSMLSDVSQQSKSSSMRSALPHPYFKLPTVIRMFMEGERNHNEAAADNVCRRIRLDRLNDEQGTASFEKLLNLAAETFYLHPETIYLSYYLEGESADDINIPRPFGRGSSGDILPRASDAPDTRIASVILSDEDLADALLFLGGGPTIDICVSKIKYKPRFLKVSLPDRLDAFRLVDVERVLDPDTRRPCLQKLLETASESNATKTTELKFGYPRPDGSFFLLTNDRDLQDGFCANQLADEMCIHTLTTDGGHGNSGDYSSPNTPYDIGSHLMESQQDGQRQALSDSSRQTDAQTLERLQRLEQSEQVVKRRLDGLEQEMEEQGQNIDTMVSFLKALKQEKEAEEAAKAETEQEDDLEAAAKQATQEAQDERLEQLELNSAESTKNIERLEAKLDQKESDWIKRMDGLKNLVEEHMEQSIRNNSTPSASNEMSDKARERFRLLEDAVTRQKSQVNDLVMSFVTRLKQLESHMSALREGGDRTAPSRTFSSPLRSMSPSKLLASDRQNKVTLSPEGAKLSGVGCNRRKASGGVACIEIRAINNLVVWELYGQLEPGMYRAILPLCRGDAGGASCFAGVSNANDDALKKTNTLRDELLLVEFAPTENWETYTKVTLTDIRIEGRREERFVVVSGGWYCDLRAISLEYAGPLVPKQAPAEENTETVVSALSSSSPGVNEEDGSSYMYSQLPQKTVSDSSTNSSPNPSPQRRRSREEQVQPDNSNHRRPESFQISGSGDTNSSLNPSPQRIRSREEKAQPDTSSHSRSESSQNMSGGGSNLNPSPQRRRSREEKPLPFVINKLNPSPQRRKSRDDMQPPLSSPKDQLEGMSTKRNGEGSFRSRWEPGSQKRSGDVNVLPVKIRNQEKNTEASTNYSYAQRNNAPSPLKNRYLEALRSSSASSPDASTPVVTPKSPRSTLGKKS